jgi:two-component system LytT family response regulator
LKKIKAILIDDESSSRNSLKKRIMAYCEDIEIIGECESGEEGLLQIEEKQPDLVFLDVEMPRMNGFTMLQHLKNRNFELIFTTAYDHYAIQAIRYSALDYLVKPIEVSELIESVKRVKEKREQHLPKARVETLLYNLMDEKMLHHRIAISSLDGFQFVPIYDIICLEANSNYTEISVRDKSKITVAKTLKEFEELLPASIFIRIHHSYIINKNFVQRYIKGEGGQVVMANGKILDVSRRKKDLFLKSIL